ncbi:MAG: alpha/beta fold hydrolase, partial [Myxococcota bacterium]
MNARTAFFHHEHHATLPSPLALHHGGHLEHGVVRFVDSEGSSTPVVLLGGVSARAEWSWWPKMVGPSLPLDPDRERLIGIDYLEVPTVDTRDQARAIVAVLDRLGLERVRVIGGSYGAMVALALGAIAPERIERMLVVAGAHRPHALGTAWRTVQRRILDLAVAAGAETEGVVLARALAMTTFRSPEEFERRFGQPGEVSGDEATFPVDSYIEHNGQRFAERFTASTYRALVTSVDLHRVDPVDVIVPTHVVGYRRDQLVPAPL